MSSAGPIARLVCELGKLPGVGEKTAARLAFHILRASPEDAAALAAAIGDMRAKISFCSVCWDFTEQDPCPICRDARRDSSLVCVVAQPQDVLAIERAGGYRGRYHVLHGVLSPLDGIGPDDLRVAELVKRCSGDIQGGHHRHQSECGRAKPPRCIWPNCCGRSACAAAVSPWVCPWAASWSMPTA